MFSLLESNIQILEMSKLEYSYMSEFKVVDNISLYLARFEYCGTVQSTFYFYYR